jgi:hypothetical protein
MAKTERTQSYTQSVPELIATEHNTRRMKSYLVFDTELKNISMLNAWAMLFFSMASSCLSVAIGLWSNLFITDSPSSIAQRYGASLEWTFAVLAAVFIGLGLCAIRSRTSQIDQIKRESAGGIVPPVRK